jgi:hypothetical protein
MTHHLSDFALDLPSNTTTQADHVVLTHDEDHARADPALRGHHAPALLLQTRQGQDQGTLHGTSVQGGADVRPGIDYHPRESRYRSVSLNYTKPNHQNFMDAATGYDPLPSFITTSVLKMVSGTSAMTY